MTENKIIAGELLDMLEEFAGDYYQGAIESIKRDRQMYDLTKEDPKALKVLGPAAQRFVNAVLVSFINFIAWHGYRINRGERPKHLAEAFERNKQERKKLKKLEKKIQQDSEIISKIAELGKVPTEKSADAVARIIRRIHELDEE